MDIGRLFGIGTLSIVFLTAITTALVTLFSKKIADAALHVLGWPFKRLYNLLYRWIAPRNPFSISMRTYRKNVLRSNIARMENPVGPSLQVPLETAFAPLKLISSSTKDSIDLYNYIAENSRCMVLGGPGSGKTTLMKSLVVSVLRKRCHQSLNDLIPVFIVLRNLAKKKHAVTEAIVDAFADHHFPGATDFVASALGAGKMIVVLDGLDEVGVDRPFVVSQILNFCKLDDQRTHKNRLLVTCREHSYRTVDLRDGLPEILRVEAFTNHHIRLFLEGWPKHKDRSAISLYADIQGDAQLRDICRNPLLLTILTGLYLDTNGFEIPTSRESFYKLALDELLHQRPARRQIEQKFREEIKRQVLARVALERLECVQPHEDSETLTIEALHRKAAEVIKQDNFDFDRFLYELVEVNGLIRPTGDGTYTCAHRTIQEYLAACEAMRSRNTEEVLLTFSDRPEIIEVLYFYCGLLRNVKSMASVVQYLTERAKWIEAARCLLYMKEAPSAEAIEQISERLYGAIETGDELQPSLEVLSSLANRRDQEFDPARDVFLRAIDRLDRSDDTGASALKSAIATSPEMALRLIPGLLRHRSERWKAAGVQLLRDIGTEEGLDYLIRLLAHEDTYVRSRAGLVLANLLKTRNGALRQRLDLFSERRDIEIWPIEAYFPGSIAIPIAEAIAPGERSELSINKLRNGSHQMQERKN